MPLEVIVPKEADGRRADAFLASLGESGLTRNAAQRLLAEGNIKRGTKDLCKSDRVYYGDAITIHLPPAVPSEIRAEDIPLDVVYEDNVIIVINKPRGLVVHPAAGHFDGTLVNALLHHCKGNLSGIGGVERPGIVHRLDKDTSGLLVAAKNDAAHVSLSVQLADRTMGRIYHAVCMGVIKKETFTIDAPIGRHPTNRQKMAVRPTAKFSDSGLPAGTRQAITHIKVLKRLPEHNPRYTLIEARLETGRTHQIRVHMAHAGYPILGDTLYGPEKQPKINGSRYPQGQMLYAKRLEFLHPSTGEAMAFEGEIPEDMRMALYSISTRSY
ncbi:MAG: RluA family pseudouridine synthase [Defluviitaleaceae bacterium]|nr:RluA family pseudouridine synthase [Defluviitaleaceae bacterium]